jgi:nicotinamidase-related amidase
VLPPDAALLLIDVQTGFDHPRWGLRNNPQAEENIARLLAAWRRTARPIIHVQHLSREPDSPLRPGQPGCGIKEGAAPLDGEPVIQKHVNSAFIGTDLEARLRSAGISTLIVVGLTTDHCVSTTVRMAGNLGFMTYVVSDATATFGRTGPSGRFYDAEAVHDLTLASLQGEFAEVWSVGEVLAELEREGSSG